MTDIFFHNRYIFKVLQFYKLEAILLQLGKILFDIALEFTINIEHLHSNLIYKGS